MHLPHWSEAQPDNEVVALLDSDRPTALLAREVLEWRARWRDQLLHHAQAVEPSERTTMEGTTDGVR